MKQLHHSVAGQPVEISPEIEERFWAKVEKTDTCWIWKASKHQQGYGEFNSSVPGHSRGAHRFAYEFLVGEVPSGLVLDHLCRNRACVRPDHLEPVTHAENVRRGESGNWQRKKTHCPRGHEYSPENTVMQKHTRGGPNRVCLTCRREKGRESQRRYRKMRRENLSP